MDRFLKKIELLLKYIHCKISTEDRRKVAALVKKDRAYAELFASLKELHKEGSMADWEHIHMSAQLISSRIFDDFQKRLNSRRVNHGVRVYDSRVLPLPAGVRPAVVDSRRLKFVIEEINLEISLYPISVDSYEIIGRIAGIKNGSLIRVELISGKTKFIEEADQYYLFRFARVPVMAYTLNIYSDSKIIGKVDIEL